MDAVISIHVLREEDDIVGLSENQSGYSISIHVLREEDDRRPLGARFNGTRFQSTSSARRTTVFSGNDDKHLAISIHVLREEDDSVDTSRRAVIIISIHVLREEDDPKWTPRDLPPV